MGLLEKLERDVQQAREAEDRQAAEARWREQRLAPVLNARLQALYRYFGRFKDHLDTMKPRIIAAYDVEGFGKLGNLSQSRYHLFADAEGREMTRFTFEYWFASDDEVETDVGSSVKAQHLQEYINQHGLSCKIQTFRDQRPTQFRLRAVIPVSFEFSADLERGAVRLDVRNVDGIGSDTYRFAPDKLDRAFADEVANLVLLKRSQFSRYTGNHLTDTSRLRIRSAVARNKRRLEVEAAPKPAVNGSAAQSVARRLGLGRLLARAAAG